MVGNIWDSLGASVEVMCCEKADKVFNFFLGIESVYCSLLEQHIDDLGGGDVGSVTKEDSLWTSSSGTTKKRLFLAYSLSASEHGKALSVHAHTMAS